MSDFIESADGVSLTGNLRKVNGKPMLGTVFVEKEKENGHEKLVKSDITDKKGCFLIGGVKFGQWCVGVQIGNSNRVVLRKIDVPRGYIGSMKIDLIYPSGEIHGNLLDSQTGLRLNNLAHDWRIKLIDDITEEIVSSTIENAKEPTFKLVGIPDGSYRIEIDSVEFRPYLTEAIWIINGKSNCIDIYIERIK